MFSTFRIMQVRHKMRVKHGKADALPLRGGGLGRGAGQREADWGPVPPARDPGATCRRQANPY